MNREEQESTEILMLYSLMKSPDFFTKYASLMSEVDYASEMHRALFKVIVQVRKFKTVDMVNSSMIQEYAYKSNKVVLMSMASFMLEKSRPIANQEDFDKFKASAKSDSLSRLSQLILKKVGMGVDVGDVMNFAEAELLKIRDGEKSRDVKVYTSEEAVEMTVERIKEWMSDKSLGTGIPEVDENLFLRRVPNGLTIVGGRSGAGKTTYLCSLFKYWALNGRAGLIDSLEMTVDQLYMKMALSEPIMNNEPFTMSNFQKKEFQRRLKEAIVSLRRLPLFVKDSDSDIFRISETARQYSVDFKIEAVGIDYIQLANTGDIKEGDVERVGRVSTACKALSKADSGKNYPALKVVALSQYTEGQTSDKVDIKTVKPNNGMLRWSKQIWQDADLILHLYQSTSQNNTAGARKIILYCGKQREYLPEWEVEVDFLLNQQTFSSPKKRQLEKDITSAKIQETSAEREVDF